MELCLYHADLGYYSRNAEQFGKAGDFYTASDVNAVFGRLLARQFDEIWRALGSPPQIEILELGPGRGLFALDVLTWSEKKFPSFFHALHYSLAERSPKLRERLRGVLDQVSGEWDGVFSLGGCQRRPSGAKALVRAKRRAARLRLGPPATLPKASTFRRMGHWKARLQPCQTMPWTSGL